MKIINSGISVISVYFELSKTTSYGIQTHISKSIDEIIEIHIRYNLLLFSITYYVFCIIDYIQITAIFLPSIMFLFTITS